MASLTRSVPDDLHDKPKKGKKDKKVKLMAVENRVVIPEEDARRMLSMLNDAICRLESGKRQDNDVEVFGELAISYERLVDLIAAVDGDTRTGIKSLTIDKGPTVNKMPAVERFWFR